MCVYKKRCVYKKDLESNKVGYEYGGYYILKFLYYMSFFPAGIAHDGFNTFFFETVASTHDTSLKI